MSDHAHGDEAGWATRGPEMVSSAEVFAPMVDPALEWLVSRVPAARTILDVGSGPGVAACRLAQLAPRAEVVAADGAAPLLALAAQRAAALGLAERFTTREVRLPEDLATLPKADVIWVSGVAHHLPDAVEGLRMLGERLNPGGVLGVCEGGLPFRFLPDGLFPGLLARIEAASEEAIAGVRDRFGVYAHSGTWPDLMRAATLDYTGSRTFLLDLPAPVEPAVRVDLRHRMTMIRDRLGHELTAADRAAVDELVEGEVLQRQDIFVLAAATVHTATGS